jgi:hypothetical protein
LPQHGQGQRVGLAVIVDVNVHPVHHIEVRVGKQFFHCGVFHFRGHTLAHERPEI